MSARLALRVTLVLGFSFHAIRFWAQPQQAAAPSPALEATSPLTQEIGALLQAESVSRAHWGISVLRMDGTPVFEQDAAKLFRPASIAKLFTTAAALALLGPDHRFSTTIHGTLDKAGTVQGDLLLVGGGDAAFGTDDLPYGRNDPSSASPASDSLGDLAAQLASAGVKRITGNVIGNDTLFEAPGVPAGWAAEDLPWGYGALPSALSFGNNELEITVSAPPQLPGAVHKSSALISTRQAVPWLRITNDVLVHDPTQGETADIDAQPTSRAPQGVRLLGSIATGASPVHEHLSPADPAAYAAAALRALLLQQQVHIKGQARALHRPPALTEPFLAGLRQPGCEMSQKRLGAACVSTCPVSLSPAQPVLAEHLSAPLRDDVVFTMKTSANLHAEVLLHHLGLTDGCGGASTLQGARALRAWLLDHGLEADDVTLYDGSGLSTKDLVTPRAETHLLALAATQPWFADWFAALPVGGVDGTLRSRFQDAPLKGHVFAKTGTLGGTRALAGYVDCASGQRLIFAILVDDHQPGSSDDRTTMDRIVAAVARKN